MGGDRGDGRQRWVGGPGGDGWGDRAGMGGGTGRGWVGGPGGDGWGDLVGGPGRDGWGDRAGMSGRDGCSGTGHAGMGGDQAGMDGRDGWGLGQGWVGMSWDQAYVIMWRQPPTNFST